jgi:hypothetical protein
MTTTMTQTEIDHADALTSLLVNHTRTLDQLLDKWVDHRYRPTLRADLGDTYTQLADYYDRRAAERGIDVRAYRG